MAKTAEKRVSSAKDGARAGALINLLEENAMWNAERQNAATNNIRRLVDKTKTINPDFRKELLKSWDFFKIHYRDSSLTAIYPPPSTPSTLPRLPLSTPN